LIADTRKGKGVRGLLDYCLAGGRGKIVAGVLAGRTPRELAAEFGAWRCLNPKLKKAVVHISLSPAPGDPVFDASQWQAVATQLMADLLYADAPWCAVVHDDCDGRPPHLHIIACRIDLSGKTISDANDFLRIERSVRGIESTFGLRAVGGSRSGSPKPKPKSDPKEKKTSQPQGEPTMTDTTTQPSNPFDPADALGQTFPQSFEPGAIMAEIAMVKSFGATVPGAVVGEPVSAIQRKHNRRVVLDRSYDDQLRSMLGSELTKIWKSPEGPVLHFRDGGQILDQGDTLLALGGMQDELAARRIVRLGARWDSITFTGSDRFVEFAMREAMAIRLPIHTIGPAQAAILAKLIAERQGGMVAVAGPVYGTTITVDPVLAPLAELDNIQTQTLPARTAPQTAPVVSPPAPESAPSQPAKAPVVGVLPGFLNLRERIKERRDQRTPAKTTQPERTEPIRPARPGL